MAGNIVGDNTGNVLVEFDYNNIILIDPNKTIDNRGNIQERLVDHENLVMYANLEADVIPRTKLAVGATNDLTRTTISVASMNFLRPGKNTYLTSGYVDELTGMGALQGQAGNQTLQKFSTNSDNSKGYGENTVVDQQSVVDNGLLGITSINVKVSASFIPSVSIRLEDVQGKALFQLGNNSPYSAFFNLPYPQFYLTLKGYFGQAIRYQLNLEKFNARFNSSSGNYEVSLEFKGYKFNILNEITVQHLLATPLMYSKQFQVTTNPVISNSSTDNSNLQNQTSGQQTGKVSTSNENSNSIVNTIFSSRGYEKIKEVYGEYKSKGLISPNFPEYTFMELVNKLDVFEKNIISSFDKAQVEPLTNIRNYKKVLKVLFESVRGNKSWFTNYLEPTPIIYNDDTKVYYFKKLYLDRVDLRTTVESKLNEIITINKKTLNENPTLGKDGTDPIKLDNLSFDQIKSTLNLQNVNLEKTAKSILGRTTVSDDDKVFIDKKLKEDLNKPYFENNSTNPIYPPVFIFEGKGKFLDTIKQVETEANRKLQNYETAITDKLATYIQNADTGIGFKPTVRNIVAVIMATTEAFIRLMEDVHLNAWDVKYDDVRSSIIQKNNNSGVNTESNNVVEISENAQLFNQGLNSSKEPVYPWPTFFKETPDDKKGRFQLTYLGDESVVDLTQAYNFKKWPEVEFVEEYMKGLAQKFNTPTSNPPIDSEFTTFLININPIEYPENGLSYTNKEEIKFFYEIWERQLITSHYSNFIRIAENGNQLNEFISLNRDIETNNIVKSLGISSPYLTNKLKNEPLNSQNYIEFLKKISNDGTGKNYQQFIRDFYVTPQLKAITEKPFEILTLTDLGLEPQKSFPLTALKQITSNSINTPLVIDTFPFTDETWVSNEMVAGKTATKNNVYNTNKSLKVFEDRNVISNFTNLYDYNTNRPVTNFSYLNFSLPTITQEQNSSNISSQMKLFYERRRPETTEGIDTFIPTEGYVLQRTPSNELDFELTTSMMNTPYFINAIQEGTDKERNDDKYPYVAPAYLFLSSLPAATLKEKYKTKGQTSELDYIASCFNKYAGVHKMPYVWILKLGAAWYRYKTFVQTNTDILDNSWKNFDYIKNFDPTTNSISKNYTFSLKGESQKKNFQLENVTSNSISIQTGFYPKLINDFNYFLNGSELYKNYTDAELETSTANGMLLYAFPNSSINSITQVNKTLNLSTWSVLLPKNIPTSNLQTSNCVDEKSNPNTSNFIIPSFGCNINQTYVMCIKDKQAIPYAAVDLTQNPSMYNGSVRSLWGAPNYGYFDTTNLVKPPYDSYMMILSENKEKQSPLFLNIIDNYSKIEEIFSVFDKQTLDSLEQEFLNFCRPSNDIFYSPISSEIDRTITQLNGELRNFQTFMRSIMSVNRNQADSTEKTFNNAITQQIDKLKNQIINFFQYDFLLKNGNPSKYLRRVFDSYLSQNSSTDKVVSPIKFDSYILNSLPSKNGSTTLAQSKLAYPAEWQTLETEVGFSTIQGIKYSDTGCTITDFFIDNNIKFSSPNIILCAQLIKMYATQKYSGKISNAQQFKTLLTNYLDQSGNFQDLLLNQVLTKTKKELPNQTQVEEGNIQSRANTLQGKVEMYEVFKSLNDKWISGADYVTRTLFEDILFLDRASRNIGDTVILDIFAIKKMLKKEGLNEKMTVFTLISGMLIQNNFNVMPLPAYVNFYNVQDVDGISIPNPEGSLEFADNLWGTFTNVDYRNSGPKMVCFFVGKPSTQPKLPRNISPYGDDSFEMRRASQNPLIENLEGKKDYLLSNKCVGFTVDVGTRNQNIFSQLSVSQENGKATSEAIQAYYDMVSAASGKNTGTQNVSLYNFYKTRSYQCEVSCFGNALIQPTMYFNLRHVPMFNGPYYITDVNHSISPGTFLTTFTGTRQSVYDLPAIDNYLQSINQNLVSKIEALIIKTEQPKKSNITDNQIIDDKSKTPGDPKKDTPNSCTSLISGAYSNWDSVPNPRQTTINIKELVDVINTQVSQLTVNSEKIRSMIYILSYVNTFNSSSNTFNTFENNLGLIDLTRALPNTVDMQQLAYYCSKVTKNNGEQTVPFGIFESLSKYVSFMSTILSRRVDQFFNDQVEYYVRNYPIDNQITAQWYKDNKDKDSNIKEYQSRFKEANESAKKQGFRTDFTPLSVTTTTQNPNPVPPACPPTTISGFSPTGGTSGTIVSLLGQNLQFLKEINVNFPGANYPGVKVDPRSIQFINSNKVKFSIPTLNLTSVTNCTFNISASTVSTIIQTQQTFEFNP